MLRCMAYSFSGLVVVLVFVLLAWSNVWPGESASPEMDDVTEPSIASPQEEILDSINEQDPELTTTIKNDSDEGVVDQREPTRTPFLKGFSPGDIFEQVMASVVSIGDVGDGSGFFVDAYGHIVTNYHVVHGSRSVQVVSLDGNSVEAEVLGFDIANDLAVLRVDPNLIPIVPVIFADSQSVNVGDPVAVIGNPFRLKASLTVGVISAIGRVRPGLLRGGRPQRGLIQTDAAINPGNSGGVLLDAQGHVIGVTASIEGPVRGSVGVGFAIPSNTVTRFLPDMIAGVEVQHPWLGIEGQFSKMTLGLSISRVVPNSPSSAAGFRVGDDLLAINDVSITNFDQLADLLDSMEVNSVVTARLKRAGQIINVPVTLGIWPG